MYQLPRTKATSTLNPRKKMPAKQQGTYEEVVKKLAS